MTNRPRTRRLARLSFIACDGNARLLTLNLATWHITGTATVGDQPDVLAYDPATHDSYYPVPDGPGGHPALLTYQPAP